jgi:tRNA threonylcarbamoyladenosine biosynthesis protein TsaE
MIQLPLESIVKSESESIELIKEFSEIVQKGDVICLVGDLGSGKTFFVKHFCKLFGIEDVSSPSFAIVNSYFGKFKVYHFDFYRLKREEELFDIGFQEYLAEEDAFIFIEWSDLFPDVLPGERLEVKITYLDEQTRNIKIEKHSN